MLVSNCCNSNIVENSIDVCSKCKEHCVVVILNIGTADECN